MNETANFLLPHHHNDIKDPDSLRDQLSKNEDFLTVADVFKQISDPTRIRIFWLLCHYEECVTDIAALMNMSSPAVSHHLRVLKTCGLIVSNRNGKEMYYHAADNPQSQLLHQMIEQMMEISCPK